MGSTDIGTAATGRTDDDPRLRTMKRFFNGSMYLGLVSLGFPLFLIFDNFFNDIPALLLTGVLLVAGAMALYLKPDTLANVNPTMVLLDRLDDIKAELLHSRQSFQERSGAPGAGARPSEAENVATGTSPTPPSISREMDGHTRAVFRPALETSQRLQTEIRELTKRGNLNLILGAVTTLGGLYVLGEFVTAYRTVDFTPWEFVFRFVPRVTLAAFLQVFAYFFLRLYRQSLDEIKFYQNELTNIGAKQQALICALDAKDSPLLNAVVLKLAGTERNLISRDQTTVEIERAKLDKEQTNALSAQLLAILQGASKGKDKDPKKDP